MPLAIILKHKREINAQPMGSYTYNKLLAPGLSYNTQVQSANTGYVISKFLLIQTDGDGFS